jgi:hypothetical protein
MTYAPQDSIEIIALNEMADSLHACLMAMEESRVAIPSGNPSPFHDVLTTYRKTLQRIAMLKVEQIAHYPSY